MSDLPATQTAKELSASVKMITKLHEDVIKSVKTTMDKVIQIGEILVREKERAPYGTFTAWVNLNLPFSIRTAQNYMKVYLRKDELPEVEDVSSAYAILEDKRPKEDKRPPIYEEAEPDHSDYYYWPEISKLVSALDRSYEKLSPMRDHTTPIALSHFIGNIKDFAERLQTWHPTMLKSCPKCKGTGVNGEGPCDNCIGGLIGTYKESSN